MLLTGCCYGEPLKRGNDIEVRNGTLSNFSGNFILTFSREFSVESKVVNKGRKTCLPTMIKNGNL